MEITMGIHRVDEASSNMAHSNVYLIVNGEELLVVDTGTPGNAKKIVEYIQKIGRSPSEVSTIILTHYHMDHAGSVADLKSQTGAKVAASLEDAEFISGQKPYPKPKNILFRAATSLIKVAPTEVDIPLKEDDKIGGMAVFHIPGHTPGSIALLDEQRKVLFVGDTLRFEDGKVVMAPRHFTWNEQQEKESIRKIAALKFEVMLPGHGEVLTSGADEAVKAFLGSNEKT